MKKLFSSIFIFTGLVLSAQTGVVKGRVLDNNNFPLPGATISISPSGKSGVTDFNGFFALSAVTKGSQEVLVRYIGFESATQKIEVVEGQTAVLDFVLSPAVSELDEVVVSGYQGGIVKALNKQRNDINVTNVVSADQAGKYPDDNIGDAIKRVSGISVQNDQGEARDIIMRGFGPSLNSVTLNGDRIPSAEGDNRKVQLDLIPTNMIQSIEVTAVVIGLDVEGATLLTKESEISRLDWRSDLARIRRYSTENSTRPAGSAPEDLLSIGDLIRVRWDEENRQWRLAQVPRAQAALVSLDPKDGAIRSLVGGMGFELSKFNRATQAKRQPGSNFKAFLYAAAIENGITPATLINDAPIVLDNLSNDEIWRPENDSGRFYGPTRVRDALTFSRNLVSIRVLQRLGIPRFVNYVEELGFDTSSMARNLTLALGTHAYTPLEIAAGYAIVANGGFKVSPYLIERIENTEGEILYEANPAIACAECEKEPEAADSEVVRMEDILESDLQQNRNLAPRVMDARASFIVSSMLQDVIQRGTGRRARVLERRDIGGKTGTTNGPRDAWFSGFNPELVTTTWVGFDDYSLLGRREFGGTAALPIWIDFMRESLPKKETPLSMPAGIVRLRIDKQTGERVRGTPEGSMLEYFFEEFLPVSQGDDRAPLDTEDLKGLF